MAKENNIEVEAVVKKALPNAMFLVDYKVGEETKEALVTVAGKMRKHFIRILPGDNVLVILSPYDLTRGRIIYRQR